jgi:hypothetical protein
MASCVLIKVAVNKHQGKRQNNRFFFTTQHTHTHTHTHICHNNSIIHTQKVRTEYSTTNNDNG